MKLMNVTRRSACALAIAALLGPANPAANVTTDPTLVSIQVTPATASVAPGQNQTFTATGTFSDGSTHVLPNPVNNQGGNAGQASPLWQVHLTPDLNFLPCVSEQFPMPTGADSSDTGFSSQNFTNRNGTVHDTWSKITPFVLVDGSINETDVALNLVCTNGAATGSIIAHWTGTRYEGSFTFNGGASTGAVSITGWSSKAGMPTRRFSHGAATVNGLVYAIGGGNELTFVTAVEVYDPASDTWTTGYQPMPTSREGLGVVALGDKIYAVGGHVAGGLPSGIVEVYDPILDQWTTLPQAAWMPTPRSHLAVVTDGTYVYALGGDTQGTNDGKVATVERFDPSTLTWSTMAPMPAAGNFIVAGVLRLTIDRGVFNPTIVVVGSGNGDGPSAATDVYDIALDAWHAGVPMPAPRGVMAGAVANDGLWVVGGTTNGTLAYQTWVYYPATWQQPEGWSLEGSILTGRWELAAAVVNDVLYAIGGAIDNSSPVLPVSTNEAHSTPPVGDLSTTQSGGGSNSLPIVQWQSTNTFVADIDPFGNTTAHNSGQTTILAIAGGISCQDSGGSCATLTVTGTADTTGPMLSLPNDMTLEANGPAGASLNYFASAFDSADGERPITCTPFSGSTAGFGTTTVNCSASDTQGNTTYGSFTITVQDTHAPFMGLPNDQTREANSSSGAIVTYFVSANDSVDGQVPAICNPASGVNFPFGPTTVNCSATDSHHNTRNGGFTVTVRDTSPPSVNVPSQPFKTGATSAAGATVNYVQAVSAFDSVDGTFSPACAPASGSTFAIGSTTVSCQATDSHGNHSAAQSFTVTVTDRPIVTVPANVIAEATGAAGAAVTFTATATDFAGEALQAQCFLISGFVNGEPQLGAPVSSGATFPLGTTTVGCLATIASTNTTDGNLFTITVQDTTAPTLTLPANITAPATSASGAIESYTASATDAVDGSKSVSCTPASGSIFAIGTTTVQCAATDAHGNAASGSFSVTITAVSSAKPPKITAPKKVTEEATGPAGAVVTFTASALDPVDGVIAVTCAPTSGSIFPLGETTVTCSATNAAGKSASAIIAVTVRDKKAPKLTLPGHQVVESASAAGVAVSFIATADDVVDGRVAVTCVPASGSVFPLGKTTVSCSASDHAGNAKSGTFNVTVRDTVAPTIVSITPSASILGLAAQMVPVTIAVVAQDAVDPAPVCQVCKVTSNVKDLEHDGVPDWSITGPLSVSLEAATPAHRDRIYTIAVKCTDASGNGSTDRTTVVVSHLQ